MSSLEIESSGFEVWSFVCGAFCVPSLLRCVAVFFRFRAWAGLGFGNLVAAVCHFRV